MSGRSRSTGICWLLAASLAISGHLGDAAAQATAGIGMTPAGAQRQAACCCGTTDGRCCGMACCLTPAPPAPRVPAPSPYDLPPQSHPPAAAHPISGPLAFQAASPRPVSDTAKISADPSLQAVHVRLEI